MREIKIRFLELLNKISLSITFLILNIIFTITIIFHFLVLIGQIYFKYIWGGRLHNIEEMYVFETISIVLNMIFLFLIFLYKKIIKQNKSIKVLKCTFLIIGIVFFINTIGNIFAVNKLEMLIATPLTFILSILRFRLSQY